ncbi:MAG: hypothetical protein ACTSXQ_01945 [Alphaproteobacteria bacterium]
MDLLTAVFAGGATGIFGSFVGKIFGIVMNWQAHKMKRDEWAHEARLLELQQKARDKETEHEAEIMALQLGAVDIGSLPEDVNFDKGAASQWVVNFLRLVRPILTILLLVFAIIIWFTISDSIETEKAIIEFVLYAAMMAITWWFGDRTMRK